MSRWVRNTAIAIACLLTAGAYVAAANISPPKATRAAPSGWRSFELLPDEYRIHARASGEIMIDGDYIHFKVSSITLDLDSRFSTKSELISAVQIGLAHKLTSDGFKPVVDSPRHLVNKTLSADGSLVIPPFETKVRHRGAIPSDSRIYLSVLFPDPRAESDPRAIGRFGMIHAFEAGPPAKSASQRSN